jgi:hypothetical protein
MSVSSASCTAQRVCHRFTTIQGLPEQEPYCFVIPSEAFRQSLYIQLFRLNKGLLGLFCKYAWLWVLFSQPDLELHQSFLRPVIPSR